MIEEEDIIKAYVHIRITDCTIPDKVLDFMKNASLKALESSKSFDGCKWDRVCTNQRGEENVVNPCLCGTYKDFYEPKEIL